MPLPVRWHAASRSGHGLVERVVMWWSEDGTLEELLGRVVPEPVLARLEALDDRMAFSRGMPTRVLRRRRVAAADMPALHASPEVEPPAVGGETLDTPGATRRRVGIDVVHPKSSKYRPVTTQAGASATTRNRSAVRPAVVWPRSGLSHSWDSARRRRDRHGRR